MKALQVRSAEEGLAFHQTTRARIYDDCDIHGDRTKRTRKVVAECIYRKMTVVELGCGTCDICGPLAVTNNVYAYDCNPSAQAIALERFPNLTFIGPLPKEPQECDVLILCEFLEHISDPQALVKAWLPLAKQVVISHPLNGDLVHDLSGGEHQWSFTEEDFKQWFAIGGHELVKREVFRMGGYDIIIGRGKRME